MVLFAQQLYLEDEGAGTSFLLKLPPETVDRIDAGVKPVETREELVSSVLGAFKRLNLLVPIETVDRIYAGAGESRPEIVTIALAGVRQLLMPAEQARRLAPDVVARLYAGAEPGETHSETLTHILSDCNRLGLSLPPAEQWEPWPEPLRTIRAWLSCALTCSLDNIAPNEHRSEVYARLTVKWFRVTDGKLGLKKLRRRA